MPPQVAPLDCEPLFEVAHATLYLGNAFRITGLPVTATTREISRHADRLKMLGELKQDALSQSAAFALKPAPSVEQLREAIVRLKDPERRIVDEFFWFWPETEEGRSEDAAMQALANGDQNTAHETWCDRAQDPATGFVAVHNLAVLYHLVALDWTHYHLAESVNAEGEDTIKWYWNASFEHWRALAEDERIWDRMRSRVQAIEDARLTAGFVRRMEAALPRALHIVSGKVAVKFAQSGNLDWARIHIQFISDQRNELTTTADIVLDPLNVRLRHHIAEAQAAAKRNPKEGAIAAQGLLDQCAPHASLFELFHEKDAHQRIDLFDEAAIACLQCAISYRNETKDDQKFVELLRQAHRMAASEDARQQLDKHAQHAEINLQRIALASLQEQIRAIRTARNKFAFAQKELMGRLAAVIEKDGSASRLAEILSDDIAWVFRSMAADCWNDHRDIETALAASALAIKVCRSAATKVRFGGVQVALQKIAIEAAAHNLRLEIRRDLVEVTNAFFRYKGKTIWSEDITEVRYGCFLRSNECGSSFMFEVRSRGNDRIKIECKRFFRRDRDAQADYDAIYRALSYHIFPSLAHRIAKGVAARQNWRLGRAVFQRTGVEITTGPFWWKKRTFVPYKKLQSRNLPGAIEILSQDNPKVSAAYVQREVWNGGIVVQVVKAILQLRDSHGP